MHERFCLRCKEIRSNKVLKAKKNKKCRDHPNIDAVSGTKCLDCWCSNIAIHALGGWKFGELVKESFQAAKNCYYTGFLLVPDGNGNKSMAATLDHIIPISRGGGKIIT